MRMLLFDTVILY